MIFWERERVRRKWSKLNLIMVKIKPGERKMTRKKQMDNDKEGGGERKSSAGSINLPGHFLCAVHHTAEQGNRKL